MKKVIIIIVSIILILLVSLAVIICVYTPVIEKNNNLKFEVNSSVSSNNLIEKIEFGKLKTKNYQIDTSKIGKQDIILEIKSFFRTIDYKIEIEVIDTEKPVIESQESFTTTVNKEIDLLKDVSVTDNSNEELEVTIVGEYSFKKSGVYDLKYYTKDSSGNETYKDFILTVKENVSSNYKVSKTSKGFTIITKNGLTTIDGIVIANKTYSLPKNYGNGLTSETTNAFNNMKNAAKEDGLTISIVSGFRSYNTQVNTYNGWVAKDGKVEADTYSARPGHSEHQTGLAMDLNYIGTSFENTNEFKWLKENCYKYGFILRYPKGKDNITGYIYEPWH